jgi:uncharacterized protein (TIGR03663 family)
MSWSAERQSQRAGELTVEAVLYGAIFVVGFSLRLAALGRWPLLDQEAALALDAWRFARGLGANLRGHSPLLFHANTVLFFLTGGSDALARAVSVAFGSTLVLLPYGLRQYLGRVGALAAACMLALSPSLVYFSWAVDGSIVVAFCALALVVVVAGMVVDKPSIPPWAILPLLSLTLVAGPTAYSLLAMVAIFGLLLRFGARFGWGQQAIEMLDGAWQQWCADRAGWQRAVAAAGVLSLVFIFAFGYNPAGLQMTLDQLGQWFGAFKWLNTAQWYRIPLMLFVYEPLPLLVGLAGMVAQRGRHDLVSVLVRYWLVFALVFSLFPGYRQPSHVLLALLPLILAAAGAFEWLWKTSAEAVRRPLLWVLVGLGLAAAAAIFIHLVGYLSMPVSQYVLRMVALLIFVVAAHAFTWSLSGPEVPARAAMLTLVLLLLICWVRAEVRLNYQRGRDPVEPAVWAATSPDVLELADQAAELSSHVAGDARVLGWQVDEQLVVPIGWYLRQFESVEYFRTLPVELEDDGVVAPAEAGGPGDYVGLRFGLRSSWVGGSASLTDWLGWWTGKRATLPGQRLNEEVVLWVKPGR